MNRKAMNRTPSVTAALCAAALALAGCARLSAPRPVSALPDGGMGDALTTLTQTAGAGAPSRNDGSLFPAEMANWSPWRDDTAYRAGDIVTVRISVDNNAEKSAKTDLKRNSKINAGITSLFGYEGGLPGVGSKDPNNATTPAQLIKAESSNEFTGDADTKRVGKMAADVAALVTRVFPNGNMQIHGTQDLLINNENSILTVDGVIRPSDVSVDNVISSDRIANARIEITGRGVLSDKQRPGILGRVFDWVWPL